MVDKRSTVRFEGDSGDLEATLKRLQAAFDKFGKDVLQTNDGLTKVIKTSDLVPRSLVKGVNTVNKLDSSMKSLSKSASKAQVDLASLSATADDLPDFGTGTATGPLPASAGPRFGELPGGGRKRFGDPIDTVRLETEAAKEFRAALRIQVEAQREASGEIIQTRIDEFTRRREIARQIINLAKRTAITTKALAEEGATRGTRDRLVEDQKRFKAIQALRAGDAAEQERVIQKIASLQKVVSDNTRKDLSAEKSAINEVAASRLRFLNEAKRINARRASDAQKLANAQLAARQKILEIEQRIRDGSVNAILTTSKESEKALNIRANSTLRIIRLTKLEAEELRKLRVEQEKAAAAARERAAEATKAGRARIASLELAPRRLGTEREPLSADPARQPARQPVGEAGRAFQQQANEANALRTAVGQLRQSLTNLGQSATTLRNSLGQIFTGGFQAGLTGLRTGFTEARAAIGQFAGSLNRLVRESSVVQTLANSFRNVRGTIAELGVVSRFHFGQVFNSLTNLNQATRGVGAAFDQVFTGRAGAGLNTILSSVRALVPAFNQVRAAVGGFGSAIGGFFGGGGGGGGGGGLGGFFDGFRRQLGGLGQAFTSLGQQGQITGQSLLISFQGFARLVQAGFIFRGISAITQELNRATDEAVKFNIAIAEIQTISQATANQTDQWSAGLRRLSDSFNVDLLDTAEAAYQALSNQIVQGLDAVDFLEQALRLSKATVSDVSESVNLLTSVLNSYQLGAEEAERVSALLFKTVEFGRVRVQDISNDFGRLSSLAAPLGVSIEDLVATFAKLTIQGIRPTVALTSLSNVMTKIIKPSKALSELFDELGFESGQAAIESLGLVGVLQKVGQEAETGGIARLGQLFPNVRGLRAVFAAFANIEGITELSNQLEDTEGIVASLDSAVDIVLTNIGTKFEQEFRKIQNFFTEDIGTAFLQQFAELNDAFGEGGLSGAIISATQAFFGFFDVIKETGTIIFNIVNRVSNIGSALGLTATDGAAAIDFLNFKLETTIGFLILMKTSFIALKVASTIFNSLTGGVQVLSASMGTLRALTAANAAQQTAFTSALISARVAMLVYNKSLALGFTRLQALSLAIRASGAAAVSATGLFVALGVVVAAAIATSVVAQQRANRERERLNLVTTERIKAIHAGETEALEEQLKQQTEATEEGSKERLAIIGNTAAAFNRAFGQSTIEILKINDSIVSQLGSDATAAFDNLINKSKEFKDFQKEAFDVVVESQERINALQGELTDLFATEDIDTNNVDQVIERTKELKAEAEDLFVAGNIERARELFDQSNELLKDLVENEKKAIEEGKKLGVAFDGVLGDTRAAQALKQSLQEQTQLEEALKNNQVARVEEAQKEIDAKEQAAAAFREQRALSQEVTESQKAATKEVREQTAQLQAAGEAIAQNVVEIDKFAAGLDQIGGSIGFAQLGNALNEALNTETFGGGFEAQKAVLGFTDALAELREAQAEFAVDKSEANLARLKTAFLDIQTPLANITQQANSTFGDGEQSLSNLLSGTEVDGKTLTTIFQSINGQLKAIEESSSSLETAEQALFDANHQAGLLAASNEKLKESFPGAQVAEGLDTATEKTDTFKKRLEDSNKVIQDIGDSIRELPDFPRIPAAEGRAFAHGGKVTGGPSGTDTIPAWLTRGEFVINAKSTRKFFPQIQAINRGIPPRGFQDGGLVTNVGDINVSVQGGDTSEVTAGRIAQQINRDLRRGKIRFGR
jgi:TP901 family phage tail tape measure protein